MSISVKLITTFRNLSIPDLLTRARAVRDGSIFNNDEKYPTPPLLLPAFTGQIETLQRKYDEARSRDSVAVAEQDVAEKILLRSLVALARYACPLTYNDKPEIEYTGFLHSDEERNLVTQPGTPTFKPEILLGGGLRLNISATGKVVTYTLIIAHGNDTTVRMTPGGVDIQGAAKVHVDTHNKITITDLPVRTTVTVYAFASNTAGNSQLSAPVEITLQ